MKSIYQEKAFGQGAIKLLEIKDSDIRLLTLLQARDAVDKGLHIGGAFSAVIPMVALYYGGFININVENPTAEGLDQFVLSKGHAIATMASVYADLGYFPYEVLKNSRSIESILNGHPGPILPGVQVSTGPLGQGVSVAEGFAIAGKTNPLFDVYCLAGDGELQEGLVWEAIMYSPIAKIDNFCLIIDKNNGQLDIVDKLLYPHNNLASSFISFGWNAIEIDGTQYDQFIDALNTFKSGSRNGKPTVIISNTSKGYGGFSDFMNKHKVEINEVLMAQELELQEDWRKRRLSDFFMHFDGVSVEVQQELIAFGISMNIDLEPDTRSANHVKNDGKNKPVPERDNKIKYNPENLPVIERDKQYAASSIITGVMKEYAKDRRVVSIDADLSSTSGLYAGVAAVDKYRALNVGVAEANMMNIGEAMAVLGNNVWVSTFCPFFDWKVMRRIAIGHQERLEAIESENGWLSKGHGLNFTFLATAPNFETKTNGATHMGNDDILFFNEMAHLKIIDVSCPQQLISISQWIMEGDKGLVYLRIMRAPSGVLYRNDYKFEFGKGYYLAEHDNDKVVIISSGRGSHEALEASGLLKEQGISAAVVDMPSIDDSLLLDLYESGKLLVFAEQNNGFIYYNFAKILIRKESLIENSRVISINASDANGRPHFIHSGTYNQLISHYKLSGQEIANRVQDLI